MPKKEKNVEVISAKDDQNLISPVFEAGEVQEGKNTRDPDVKDSIRL